VTKHWTLKTWTKVDKVDKGGLKFVKWDTVDTVDTVTSGIKTVDGENPYTSDPRLSPLAPNELGSTRLAARVEEGREEGVFVPG
jgi:hypothetical protein